MRDRDLDILSFVKRHQGITANQAARLYFNNNIHLAYRRLSMLCKNEFLKSEYHDYMNKKIYFESKIPSYHSIISADLYVALNGRLLEFKREARIGNYVVDVMAMIDNEIVAFEIDIFNMTSNKKLKAIKEYLEKYEQEYKVCVISRYNTRNESNCIHIPINNIYNAYDYIKKGG